MLAWIGLRIGLTWVGGFVGDLLVGVFWGCLFPWGHGVLLFSFSFPFLFLYVMGGSGVLSHGAVFGLSFYFFYIFFSLWTLGHFLNTEHDIVLLHMSTYIAERWHRAHGLCMCRGGEAPFVRNYTHTQRSDRPWTHKY